MADNNEGSKAAPDEGLDESTRKTLEGLENEGFETAIHPNEKKPDEAKPVEDPKPKEDEKPPEDKKPDEAKPKGDDQKPPKRDVTMVEAWKLKTAEGQKAQLEKDLATAKSDLAVALADKKSSDKTDTPLTEKDTDLAKSLAEKHGITEELATDLVNMINSGQKLPADVTEALKELDTIKKERVQSQATQQFNTEFDSEVASIIKAEYPKVTEGKLSEIKDQLFKLAHSERYAGTELSVIYKGRDEFRGVVAADKPSAEGSRGGTSTATDLVDFDNVSEDDVAKMDRDTFSKYSEHMAKKERGAS